MIKKIIYLILISLCGIAYVNNATAQVDYAKYDSLENQLPLQKTSKARLVVLQQLVDADPLNEYHKVDYLTLLLQLNATEKAFNAYPYTLLQKAVQYSKAAQTQQALNSANLAIAAFDKEHKVIFPLLISVRQYFNRLNNLDARLRFFQEKLEYYQVNGPVENTAACYHGIAGYYLYNAAYNQSITNYLKAGEVFRKFNDACYVNEIIVASEAYIEWGNYDKAEYYLHNVAVSIGAKKKNEPPIGNQHLSHAE